MTEWRYAEQILYVDLGARRSWVVPTDVELKRSYVGGAGFVARLLAGDGAAEGDVVLAGGPLSDGVAGRLALGARVGARPVVSSIGGRLAAALKEAGFDAVVLRGRSGAGASGAGGLPLAAPGVLTLDPDGVSFEETFAGLEIPDAERLLARPGYTSLVLGPAAEQGDPRATVAHEGHYAGGSGVGAALGAKGIKAILLPVPAWIPSRCDGCMRLCTGLVEAGARTRADALGLDAREAGPRRRPGVGLADLLGTCQRVFRDRPGELLRDALVSTQGLLTTAS
ncbi:MAG TPA: aldehyde ferredoxin oxidoreductase N-terminal domain-containing protein [Symbiobacteriaceae bacterium]|nr:aldehyde ferredoxin oxidoreductase N-terminal domain-containing protein [Symbiobacteriaceae bacterium]